MPLAGSAPFATLCPDLVQSWYLALSSDVSTTSTSFVTLMTLPVVTTGGALAIAFSVAGTNSNNNRNLDFRLIVDGATVSATKFRRDSGAGSPASLSVFTPVSAGNHTIAVQWLVSASTGRIRASSVTEEHAALLVEEVAR